MLTNASLHMFRVFCFESSFPQSLGGNPELFLFLNDNGFPITTSGMTRTYLKINYSSSYCHPREGGGPLEALKYMDSRLRTAGMTPCRCLLAESNSAFFKSFSVKLFVRITPVGEASYGGHMEKRQSPPVRSREEPELTILFLKLCNPLHKLRASTTHRFYKLSINLMSYIMACSVLIKILYLYAEKKFY